MNEASLWRAVMARDRRRSATFVYAVRSTGIYCRATCPSRRPARDKVRFFATPDAAEAAGYRACRRCHPRDTGGAAWIDTVRRAIETRLDAPPRPPDLAVQLGMHASVLQRRVPERVGL